MIELDFDLSDLSDLAERFHTVDFEPAIARALNRAGDQIETAIGRTLADETGMHVHDVRDNMVTEQRASPGDLNYVISVSGGYQSLSEFSPNQTRKGISARPWATRRVFPHSFEIPGRDDVFVREGRERLPIRKLYGPNLALEFMRGESIEVAKETFREFDDKPSDP